MLIAQDAHGLSRLSKGLMHVALVATVLHHADHVLRVDHSGWPFRDHVTPFTLSLLAYPMIFFALWGPLRAFWLRWALLVSGTGFTLLAHTLLESPRMQFFMWTNDRSLEPNQPGVHNLLDIHSMAFGVAAVLIGMVLNGLAVASSVSMLVDGMRRAQHLR